MSKTKSKRNAFFNGLPGVARDAGRTLRTVVFTAMGELMLNPPSALVAIRRMAAPVLVALAFILHSNFRRPLRRIMEIQQSVDLSTIKKPEQWLPGEKAAYANEVSKRNILRTMHKIRERSSTLDDLVRKGCIAIVGALYDIKTGEVSFFQTGESSVARLPIPMAALA